ncbi:MAG: VWA domain-containing protein [Firmicutes bacterium]|nr:VWA domain-containing protein [Bacillota bacterium]
MNLGINFLNPYWLLLIIPAAVFIIIPFLRINKRYRKNRNRITSLVLLSIVMVLSIFVVAGFGFTYEVPNYENTMILTVDLSNSTRDSRPRMTTFVESVLEENARRGGRMQIGIVGFGRSQLTIAEPSANMAAVHSAFSAALAQEDIDDQVDINATDFAAALSHARRLLGSNTQNARIVVLTDGLETDGNAHGAVIPLVRAGIRVDTVFFEMISTLDVAVSNVIFPEGGVILNSTFSLEVEIQSNHSGPIELSITTPNHTLIDDEEEGGEEDDDVIWMQFTVTNAGRQVIMIPYTFDRYGLHTLTVNIRPVGWDDAVKQNNVFQAAFYLQSFDSILVITRDTGNAMEGRNFITQRDPVTGRLIRSEAQRVVDVINSSDDFRDANVSVKTINEIAANTIGVSNITNRNHQDEMIRYLRGYGVIILANVGNLDIQEAFADTFESEDLGQFRRFFYTPIGLDGQPQQRIEILPPAGSRYSAAQFIRESFIATLNIYVNRFGGGLLALGGDREENGIAVPNMFNQEDLRASSLQSLLPVSAINWTPPMAVMLVIDASGSMEIRDTGVANTDGTGYSQATRLSVARNGAAMAVRALARMSTHHYVGIVRFDGHASLVLPLTSLRHEQRIINAILGIQSGPMTEFAEAIRIAQGELERIEGVDIRHIFFLTDGDAADPTNIVREGFEGRFRISLSGVAIAAPANGIRIVDNMVNAAGGGHMVSPGVPLTRMKIITSQADFAAFGAWAEEELTRPELGDIPPTPFLPRILSEASPEMRNLTQYLNPFHPNPFPLHVDDRGVTSLSVRTFNSMFGHFYGTVPRIGSQVILDDGKYNAPLYTRWQFGRGRVGALTTNILQERWGDREEWNKVDAETYEWFNCPRGRKFFLDSLYALAPLTDIATRDVDMNITEDNFTRVVTGFSSLPHSNDDRLRVTVTPLDPNNSIIRNNIRHNVLVHNLDRNSPRVSFQLSDPGVYQVRVDQITETVGGIWVVREGGTSIRYTVLSQSAEFEAFPDMAAARQWTESLAEVGFGRSILRSNPDEIFGGFSETIPMRIGPAVTISLIAIALILLLLDIAARKFKWKWPWEVIAAKKALAKTNKPIIVGKSKSSKAKSK